jgi:uncharacterized membrane protein YgcG
VRRGLAALALLACTAGAAADERVLEFQSDIRIAADGTLTVTERIAVQAEGRVIKRGIFRDFPTDYEGPAGTRVRVPFEVLGVTQDGRLAQWITQSMANGVRVRIGNPGVLLPHGRHEYEIRYRTGRQLGFFADHDELYWNVNGNGWVFPFDSLAAAVALPAPVPAARLRLEAYTGYRGARGRDYAAEAEDGGARFRATRVLAAREGMTIVVAFPKGIVDEPGTARRALWWLGDNRGLAAGICGALLLVVFLAWRWRAVGRDPRAGPLFPRYEAPAGLGPAGVRFVDRMGCDDRCFVAALLGLGARGYLRIRQRADDVYDIERTGKRVDWLPGEQALAETLFHGRNAAVIRRQHDPDVQHARSGFRDALGKHMGKALFARNIGSLAAGAVIAAAAMFALIADDSATTPVVALGATMLVTLILFSRWLPAYSVQGRKIQDEIEGLRQYLGVAEADELARMKAPPQTPEEFARFLPYAFALGVEKNWTERFAATLGAAAVAAAVAGYYASATGLDSGVGSLADSVSGLDGTISAAATPPGSSSGGSGGGGGGGSSGGGGGGGGGGGW